MDTDRGYALAWQRNKAETCPGCGTRADDWAEDADAYYGDQTYCEGCARLAEERSNIRRDADGHPRPGFHAFLTPAEVYEARHPDGLPFPDQPDDD